MEQPTTTRAQQPTATRAQYPTSTRAQQPTTTQAEQPAEQSGQLDYLSFIDHAVTQATTELPAIDPVSMRMVLTLHRLTSTLVYDLESTVHRPTGWTWSGFRMLFVLWLAGPLEAKRVAELSGTSRAAVSAAANTLQKDGLVTRERSEHDGRSVRLSLTATGHTAITTAFEEHNKREQSWAGTLTADERGTLIALMEKLIHGAEAVEAKRRF